MTDETTPNAEVVEAFNEFRSTFQQFTEANDQRLSQIESKGSADVVTSEKVERLNNAVDTLEKRMDDLAKKSGRPGASGSTTETKHNQALRAYLRTGDEAALAEFKAMSVGSDSSANTYLITPEMQNVIRDLGRELSPMRAYAEVLNVTNPDFSIPFNLGGTGSGWVDEDDARPETATPVVQKIKVNQGEIYAYPHATQASIDDLSFNVEAFLAAQIAREFNAKEGAAFLTGNGTNKPKGLLAGATATTADSARAFGTIQHFVTGQAAALPTTADALYNLLIDVQVAMKSEHLANAVWGANGVTAGALRKYKDADGRPLWEPALTAGQPNLLVGRPFVRFEDAANIGAGALPLFLGNLKAAYTIVDRNAGISLRDNLTNKPYVGFYVTKRVGGCLTDSEAVKVIKVSA